MRLLIHVFVVAISCFTGTRAACADSADAPWRQRTWAGPWHIEPALCVDLSKMVLTTHRDPTKPDPWRFPVVQPKEVMLHTFDDRILGLELIRVYF